VWEKGDARSVLVMAVEIVSLCVLAAAVERMLVVDVED
jgi:hypothetical protein